MAPNDKGSSVLRSIASSWLGLGVGIGIAFVLSPFVVNRLGAAWYGVWAVAAQFTGYLYLLDFGVRESVVRYTSKYVARSQGLQLNRVLTAAVLLYAPAAFLALAATSLFVWRVPYWFSLEPHYWRDTRLAVGFAGATIAQTFLLNVFTGIILGLRRWDLANVMGIAAHVGRAGLIVFFLLRGHGIVAVAAIQACVALASGIANMVVALVLLHRQGMTFRLVTLSRRRFSRLTTKIFGYGFFVVVNNIGEKVIHATDAMVVGLFLPIASVAYYAIAGSLIGYARALLGATTQVFSPLASHFHAVRQQRELHDAFLLGVTITVLTAAPIAGGFIVLGREFVGLWMGSEFAYPSSQVLSSLAIALAVGSPQFVISSVLYGISRHRLIAVLRAAEAAANLALSLWLVHIFGLIGVALGTVLPHVTIVVFVLPYFACRAVGVSLRAYYFVAYIRPAIALAPFLLAAVWFHHLLPATSLLMFFLKTATLLVVVYLPSAFGLGLNADQRRTITSRLRATSLARRLPW